MIIRSRGLRAGLVTVAAWLSLVLDANSADLEAIRAAVRMQLSSLSSVQAKYTVEYRPDKPTDEDQPYAPEKIEWAEQGHLKYFFRPLQESGPRYNLILAFDGQRGYTFDWAPETQPHLRIADGISEGYDFDLLPSEPLGLRVRECRRSLADILDLGSAVLVGETRLFDVECVQVEIASIGKEDSAGRALDATVFLDSEHDYVPRRIALYRRGLDHAKWQPTWDIDELSQVRDSASSATASARYWVPRRATFRQPGRAHIMEVTEFKINDNIPVTHFRPNAPDGTQVVDEAAGGKVYVLGGLRAAARFVREASDAAREELAHSAERSSAARPAAGRQMSATPNRSGTLFYVALGTSLFFVGWGALLIRRRASQ